MDIERFPFGKFATNALVAGYSVLVYNILRWIGQNDLIGTDAPLRHIAKRHRIKTVMQELIYLASKFTKTGHCIKIIFGKCCRVRDIFEHLYHRLAYGEYRKQFQRYYYCQRGEILPTSGLVMR